MTIAHHKDEFLKRSKYKCDICGKVDFWQEGWGWYGSVLHEETCPDDLPTACSDECMAILGQKIKSGEFVLPDIRARGYRIDIKGQRTGY
jgi:hypothetical protein